VVTAWHMTVYLWMSDAPEGLRTCRTVRALRMWSFYTLRPKPCAVTNHPCGNPCIQVKKTYLSLVCGRLDGGGSVAFPLDGKPSLTEWRALGHTRSLHHGWVTTVHLHPCTGAPPPPKGLAFLHLSVCGPLSTLQLSG
jgi:hypothetical protein